MAASPLTATILGLDCVSEVLLAPDAITVNVDRDDDWATVDGAVAAAIEDALAGGSSAAAVPDVALLCELGSIGHDADEGEWAEGSVEAGIAEALEAHIRPYVREDGGEILFRGFDAERGAAKVQLVGACSGCPSSAATLHGKVKALLRHMVPEVQLVEAVEEEAGASAAGEVAGERKLTVEEHIAMMVAEGEATSVVWEPEEWGQPRVNEVRLKGARGKQ